jgi:hypothetical protein
MANWTDHAENKIIDLVFRAQAWSLGADLHFSLFTTAPTDSTAGTECSYTGYARVAVTRSLANFAGTQSAGSTVASSGTGGTTSNNATITFGQKTDAGSVTVVAVGVHDATTGGNLIAWAPLSVNKTINQNDPAPYIAAAGFTFQVDN